MKENNWIEWNGGECPVPKGTLVDLRYRANACEDRMAVPALTYGNMSDTDFWQHESHACDIIAYRLHQPEQQAWSGEGLPPVGTECELKFEHCSEWERYNILCIGKRRVFVSQVTRSGEIFEGVVSLAGVMFRPIRTEAERKREEILKELRSHVTNFNKTDVLHAIEEVYDAIAAGKIPGVKLED